MKQIFALLASLSFTTAIYGQAYIPMPTSSVWWRYRMYVPELVTNVFDDAYLMEGNDTTAFGQTYSVITGRELFRSGRLGYDPPVKDDTADYPDVYYCAIREESKKVYQLTDTGEFLLYNFNVGIGDSIPDYFSNAAVTSIDSVLLGGVFHKRYMTSDSGFYVIEGVGSSRGLFIDLTNGHDFFTFYCFNSPTFTFKADTTLPCAYLEPWYLSGVSNVSAPASGLSVYPNPSTDELTLMGQPNDTYTYHIVNITGQTVDDGQITGQKEITTTYWSRGLYIIIYNNTTFGDVYSDKILLR